MAEERLVQARVTTMEQAEFLRKMVRTVVYAKQHGMLDHPEARNVLHQAFRSCGLEIPQRGQTGPGNRG
jgi:hypothetical protein